VCGGREVRKSSSAWDSSHPTTAAGGFDPSWGLPKSVTGEFS